MKLASFTFVFMLAASAVAQTPLSNLLVTTNSASELLISNTAAGAGQGPPTNLANIRGRVNSANELLVACSDCGTNGAGQLIGAGSAPTVDDTSANSCGTTDPAIVGADSGGKVTVGATAGTSCTVTFATEWANAPACVANNETTGNLARATSTATTVVLAGTFVAADVVSFVCVGY